MRIKSVHASNFGSYKELAFGFEEATGLTLIQGATGSGKSTLCDVTPWVLFGRTAKNGSVDEIRSWGSRESTTGRVLLSLPDGEWEVIRVRGKTNDLAFRRAGDESLSRGKDLTDTQRLLNEVLGMDFELYLAGAYYHEFSQTAQFFTTTPKNRRTICEQLVDLSIAVKLQEKLKNEKRELDKQLLAAESDLRLEKHTLQLLQTKEANERTRSAAWETTRHQRLIRCGQEFESFEASRKRIISRNCKACGTNLEKPREVVDDSENPHFRRLQDIEAEKNPYEGEVKSYKEEIKQASLGIRDTETRISVLRSQSTDYEYLSEVADRYRSQTINKTIQFIEEKTNQLLNDFFDAEIRVKFLIETTDKLDVTLFKDGNEASFTQLSKGQRCELKLCFGIAVMETIQNHHGVALKQLFYDEALDGLDDYRKLRAYQMLETLTLDRSVFLVEHSESLKAFANNKYQVNLVNGESQLAKA